MLYSPLLHAFFMKQMIHIAVKFNHIFIFHKFLETNRTFFLFFKISLSILFTPFIHYCCYTRNCNHSLKSRSEISIVISIIKTSILFLVSVKMSNSSFATRKATIKSALLWNDVSTKQENNDKWNRNYSQSRYKHINSETC